MAKTGRPKKQIDKDIFESLCGILCTEEEIANAFNCSIDTINRWCKKTYKETFAEAYKKFSVDGKISLRRAQFNLAQKSAAMAIFLGKNYLNQTDTPDEYVEIEDVSEAEKTVGFKVHDED